MLFAVSRRDAVRENGLSRRTNRPTALWLRALSAASNNRMRLPGEFRLRSLTMFSLLCRDGLNGECPLILDDICRYAPHSGKAGRANAIRVGFDTGSEMLRVIIPLMSKPTTKFRPLELLTTTNQYAILDPIYSMNIFLLPPPFCIILIIKGLRFNRLGGKLISFDGGYIRYTLDYHENPG